MVAPILVLDKVCKRIGNEQVLDNLSLAIAPGEFIVVRGRSGVGKTTLAKLVSLIIRPDKGRILFLGKDITSLSDYHWSIIRLKYIGYIDQFFKLIPHMSVLENVELPLTLMGLHRNERRKRALEILSKLGLKDKIDRFPEELSGGERQRVAIARALVKNPLIIVADEALSNLDNHTALRVLDILKRIALEEKTCILLTTTDLSYDFKADRDYILVNGKLYHKRANAMER